MRARLRATIRGASVLSRIVEFLVLGAFREAAMGCRRLPRPRRQERRAWSNARAADRLLRYLGFECRFANTELLDGMPGGALIVANHLSFWDAVALSSRFSCLFITSVEVRDTPVLGWIARLGGCVFVERRDRAGIDGEIAELVAELRAGRKVVLFPEGTSGDGSQLLPFKRSLFRAAVLSGCPVVPACLNYRGIDGVPLCKKTRDWLFYYGDQNFATQLARVFALRSVVLDVELLEPILPGDAPDEHRTLCERSFAGIRCRFDPIGAGSATA